MNWLGPDIEWVATADVRLMPGLNVTVRIHTG